MDATVRMMGWLRAKGAEMVSLYNDLKATTTATEAELMAAEDSMRAPGVASAGAPAATVPVSAAVLEAAKAAAKASSAQYTIADGGMDGAIPFHYLYASADKSGAIRVDDIVPSGTPGTITLPKTGHVLSLPQPRGKTQAGTPELFFGYAQRVINQATNGQADKYMASLAALLIGGGIGATSDPMTWPEAADRFFNVRAYMTDAERAAADAAWAGWTIKQPTSGGSDAVPIPKG